ncbi:MAG: hypothetical protein KC422_06955 [Trueperaceae bacterium]|nr:hypothetical protein [Trueperaceae bacterium]
MTLRLRLTLFYTLLVACILLLAGFGLHLLLEQSLRRGIDENLRESSELVAAIAENRLADEISFENEELKDFSKDDIALIYNSSGSLVQSLGEVPEGFQLPEEGYTNWQEWRVLHVTEPQNVVVMQATTDLAETLKRFDGVFLWIIPLIITLAFLIGYAFSGAALAPVHRLTEAAYTLANRSEWRETLPEPKQKDELWRLSRATNTLLKALSRVIESERRFTDDAAHELKTPLSVLSGRLEKALEQSTEEKVRRSLEKALISSKDLLTLVEKLLLLARTEAGQGLSKTRLDLVNIAKESAHLSETRIREKGLELKLKFSQQSVSILGDETALRSLITNLLENALKFTGQGTIRLELNCQADSAELSVCDTGPGIAEAALPHLFDRFYQADVSHRSKGSGLGLAIVKSIADWHGANVEASNLANGGACFRVRFPLAT